MIVQCTIAGMYSSLIFVGKGSGLMNRSWVVLLVFSLFLTGCASKHIEPKDSVMFKSFDDFRPGPKGGVDLVWSAPKIKDPASLKKYLGVYDKVLMDQVWVVVDKDNTAFTKEEIEEIRAYAVKAIQQKLTQRYTLVDSVAPNTLRLSMVLTNIETANTLLAITSSIVPVGVGISTLSWVVTGEPTNVGSARVELMLSDAETGEPLIAAIDRRVGSKDLGTILHNTDDVKDAIDWWASRLGASFQRW